MSALESVMRRVFLGLLIGLVLFPAASRAQEAPAHACDLAAASPYDSMRPSEIPGISFEKIDAKVALPACQAALATDPENPRLLYEMGRAYEANKDDTQARTFYEKAAARGNPGAQHNLSNFYARGLGGLPKSASSSSPPAKDSECHNTVSQLSTTMALAACRRMRRKPYASSSLPPIRA
jgi:TPR repeat protein